MSNSKNIIRISRYIILSGCLCFLVYFCFLLVSYFYGIDRQKKKFEDIVFPELKEKVDARTELFFRPITTGLSLLSETLDWNTVMRNAASGHGRLKSDMKKWAEKLGVTSVGVSDRDRKIVWDYWSDDPIALDPENPRDGWFFDFWKRDKIPDWTYTLYSEDSAKGYQLYLDRLIRSRKGRPIGSVAAQISLNRFKEQLLEIISGNERIFILDGKDNILIDLSRNEIGDKVKSFGFSKSGIDQNIKKTSDPLIKKILSQTHDNVYLDAAYENIFYNKTSLFNGEISVFTILDSDQFLQKERNRLIKDLIVLFGSFSIFIGGMLINMMLYSQKLKSHAMSLNKGKSKFEDLLFIITHGIGSEILALQKNMEALPPEVSSGLNLRFNEMSLMIQNAVNAARLDESKNLIVFKNYDFSWQWKKLAGSFRQLSVNKGQTFSVSPDVHCIINNDEEMVYQILENLVSNAIKFAPRNGEVKLDCRIDGDILLITISDSGSGFLPEERKDMFLKFKKLSTKPTGGERSTGLGLYITKQLADACGIRLVLSEDSEGHSGAVWMLELKTAQSGI